MPTSISPKRDAVKPTDWRWPVSFFAAYIMLACLFGFLATHPKVAAWVSDGTPEFAGSNQQPTGAVPVQLADRKPTIK